MTGDEMKEAMKNSMKARIQKEVERVNGALKVEQTVDPEYILWENIAYSDK